MLVLLAVWNAAQQVLSQINWS